MTSAVDWRPYFQSRAFTREQVQALQRLFEAYATSVDGFAAPIGAGYITAVSSAVLTAERVLTAGAGIGLTDAGANSTMTVENTDRGSTAVATHEAALDPHPQYTTAAELAAYAQPLSAVLTAYAGGDTPSAFTLSIVDSADAAAWRTAIGAGTGSGTVTSVALAVPSGLDVTGSPITGAGTLTITVADAGVFRSTIGLGTMATQNASSVAITGGTINGTSIGATTPSTGAFTTISATGAISSSLAANYGLQLTGASTSFRGALLGNTGASLALGIEGSPGGSLVSGSAAYSSWLVTFNAEPVGLAVNNTRRLQATNTGVDVFGPLAVTGAISATTTVSTGTYTVGTLPAGSAGMRAFVTDANATTFASIVAGGGANGVPVFYDGSNWRIG